MRRLSILFIFVLLGAASCRRKGDASGRVFNVFNGQPIEGIGVRLVEYKHGVTGKRTRSLGSAVTNSGGEYAFNYGAKFGSAGYNRLITLDETSFDPMDTSAVLDKKYDIGHYPGCKTTKWDYSGHSRANQDFTIAPLSRVKIIPNNVTHIYDGVTLRIELYDDNYSTVAGYYNNGNVTNPNYYTQFPSNGRIYIFWQFVGWQTFYDTIQVAPFAKVTYRFNY